ncbi:hypothetical protein [Amycolatopsis circi]|uniref:hypothetical protein n=1 Tax=Amycolatopsis circi TaxID=871959 RepID=UPI0013BE9973|nr:hypothetical protein [Amycolatopsis circi]
MIKRAIIGAAGALAALSLFAAPAATASPISTNSAVAASAHVLARYTITVKCDLVRISPYGNVGYVYGTGSASSYGAAFNNAEKDANTHVPAGHYKRHCRPI